MIYRLTYKALSPLHIGYKQIGFLKTTRYYITGRAVWGAVTANVTRHLIDTPTSNDYERVGEFVRENIRSTYFFPKVESTVYCFIYKNEELKYGDLSKNQFEKTFIHSFVSTALDRTGTADEGTLHETEYIRDKVRMKDDIKNVYWVGYLFVGEKRKDDLEIRTKEKDFTVAEGSKVMKASEILKRIEIGGERNYGFGKLELEGTLEKANEIFGHQLDGDRIESEIALSHVKYEEIAYTGDVEPLVGREWGEGGSGRKTFIGHGRDRVSRGVYFVPGTCFGDKGKFEVADYGIWNLIRDV
ncbi:MAG: hypothetical protein WBA22_00410 [Candidatus Methanofastidiosia archaeon]|jgi:hypothetical protein